LYHRRHALRPSARTDLHHRAAHWLTALAANDAVSCAEAQSHSTRGKIAQCCARSLSPPSVRSAGSPPRSMSPRAVRLLAASDRGGRPGPPRAGVTWSALAAVL